MSIFCDCKYRSHNHLIIPVYNFVIVTFSIEGSLSLLQIEQIRSKFIGIWATPKALEFNFKNFSNDCSVDDISFDSSLSW